MALPKGWKQAQNKKDWKNLREIEHGKTVESWKNTGVIRKQFVDNLVNEEYDIPYKAFYGYEDAKILTIPNISIKKTTYSDDPTTVYEMNLRYPHALEGKGRKEQIIYEENYQEVRRMAMALMRMTEGDLSYADWKRIHYYDPHFTEEEKEFLTVPEDWRGIMMRSTSTDTGY